MEKSALLLFALLSIAATPATGQIAVSASVGSLSELHRGWSTPHLDFVGSLWYKVDQMVLIGLSSGVQSIKSDQQIPLLGSLYLRLPIGRTLLPVATADWGYLIASRKQGWLWRVGGGIDLKLGDRSSLIALLGSQQSVGSRFYNRPYARAGLLLEW